MPLKRPYYALHQIERGKYTIGGEYYKEDGNIYVGPYHVLPTGKIFTGFTPNTNSEELYTFNNSIQRETVYRGLTTVKTGKYVEPKFYRPKITNEDRNQGFVIRYFVQLRNDPKNTIIEIDEDQYNSINIINGIGINGVLWNKARFQWYIRGEIEVVTLINARTLSMINNSFPGITKYIKNMMEFFS